MMRAAPEAILAFVTGRAGGATSPIPLNLTRFLPAFFFLLNLQPLPSGPHASLSAGNQASRSPGPDHFARIVNLTETRPILFASADLSIWDQSPIVPFRRSGVLSCSIS